jgi:cytidine deaminase
VAETWAAAVTDRYGGYQHETRGLSTAAQFRAVPVLVGNRSVDTWDRGEFMQVAGLDVRALLDAAKAVAVHSYVPYSKKACGAVLVAADGRRFTGASVEVCNYVSSVCAPKAALVNALSAGAREFSLIVVAGAGVDMSYLCGDCRQSYAEFSPGMNVVSEVDPTNSRPLSSLLPEAFGISR